MKSIKLFNAVLFSIWLLTACTPEAALPSRGQTPSDIPNDLPAATPRPNDDSLLFIYPENWPKTSVYNINKDLSGDLTIMLCLDHSMTQEIMDFKRIYPNVQLNIIDYSLDEDPNGEKYLYQVNTMLMSGEAPDLLDLRSHSFYSISEKGFFDDLYEYIDNDPDMERSEFYQNILQALETNGKLFHITPRIYHTFFKVNNEYYDSLPADFAVKGHTNYYELVSIYKDYLNGGGNLQLMQIFTATEAFTKDDYFINYKDRKVNFGDEFVDLIKFFIPHVTGITPTNNKAADCLFPIEVLSSCIYEALDYSNKPYAGFWFLETIHGKKFFETFTDFAIPVNAKNKQAAWEFLKYMIMNQYTPTSDQRFMYFGYSIHRNSFFKIAKFTHLYNEIKARGSLTTDRQTAVETFIGKIDERNGSVDSHRNFIMKDEGFIYEVTKDISAGIITPEQAAEKLQDAFTIRVNE